MKRIYYLLLATLTLCACTKEYTVPTVVTGSTYEVDAASQYATLHGTVTDDGGLDIIETGICWGTSYYSTSDHRLQSGNSGNDISVTLTGLSNGQTYYFRAYAKNKLGEGYGDIYQFTFQGISSPNVTTGSYSLSGTTATCYGNATSQSNTTLTQAGICFRSGSGTPTLNDNVRYASGVTGNTSASFSCQLVNLSTGTYSYRAFATNSAGTSYGTTKTFTVSGGSSTGTYRITYNGSTWAPASVKFYNYTSDGYVFISAYKNSADADLAHPTVDIRVWGYLESTTGSYTYSSSGGDIMRFYDPNNTYEVSNTIILSNGDTVAAGTYYRYTPITSSFTETITAIDLTSLTMSATWSEQLFDIEQYINSDATSYGTTRSLSGVLTNYHWAWSTTSKGITSARQLPLPNNGIKCHIPKPLKQR